MHSIISLVEYIVFKKIEITEIQTISDAEVLHKNRNDLTSAATAEIF